MGWVDRVAERRRAYRDARCDLCGRSGAREMIYGSRDKPAPIWECDRCVPKGPGTPRGQRRIALIEERQNPDYAASVPPKPTGELHMESPLPPEAHRQGAIALGVCKWWNSPFDPDSPLLNVKITETDIWTMNAREGTLYFRLPWDRVTKVELRKDRGSFYIYSDVGCDDMAVYPMHLELSPMSDNMQPFIDHCESRFRIEIIGQDGKPES